MKNFTWLRLAELWKILIYLMFTCAFGSRFDASKVSEVKDRRTSPLGRIEIVGSKQEASLEHIDVWTYKNIYGAIGVTREKFTRWEDRYGMDSLGTGNSEILAEDFPIFSKVAWMHIDSVDLSESETTELIRECERAMESTDKASALEELGRIRQLGLKAIAISGTLRFGHP